MLQPLQICGVGLTECSIFVIPPLLLPLALTPSPGYQSTHSVHCLEFYSVVIRNCTRLFLSSAIVTHAVKVIPPIYFYLSIFKMIMTYLKNLRKRVLHRTPAHHSQTHILFKMRMLRMFLPSVTLVLQ